jgi:hypothetical protein
VKGSTRVRSQARGNGRGGTKEIQNQKLWNDYLNVLLGLDSRK